MAVLAKGFDNQLIELFTISFGIVSCIFSSDIYDVIFYNSNSPCAEYARSMALQKGFSPRAQNDLYWNPEEFKLSEVYALFPNNRTNMPKPDSSGFIFFTNKKHTYSRYMEFYEYDSKNDYLIHYEFYFDSRTEDGDSLIERKLKIKDITNNMLFVPLERM